MKRYTLLTADMDGTVLNTRKEITPRTAGAIHQALADGWEVLFATGRCLAEVRPYLTDFPDMHYLLCHSGATVTDLRTGQDLCSLPIDPETVEKVLAVTADAYIIRSASYRTDCGCMKLYHFVTSPITLYIHI